MKEEIPVIYFKEDADAYYYDVPDKLTGERKEIVILKKDIRKDIEDNKVYIAPVKEYKMI